MSHIKIENLSKKFGKNTVVKHINLSVEDGSLVSILGPSGCGKTTILRMIAGFEKPDEGQIFFDNEPVDNIPVSKRNIGMVFQSYALFPHMTVAKNVAYGLEQRGVPQSEIEKRVSEILEKVHMEKFANRKPRELSGGQQQRVALARSLVIQPNVMLLDECLSALDKKLRVEMQTELRKLLNESKVTAFFVTHDQEEAMTMSDKIVVMRDGKVEQTGSPREVYEHPKNKFVADFLGKASFFEGKLESSKNGLVTIVSDKGTITIRGNVNSEIGRDVILAIRPENVKMRYIGVKDFEKGELTGKITTIVYSGNILSSIVDCNGLIVRTESTGGAITPEPKMGDEVVLSWKPELLLELEN